MRKLTALIICLLLGITALSGCAGSDNETAAPSDSETSGEETTPEETKPEPIEPESLGKHSATYETSAGSVISSYNSKSKETYLGVCAYYSNASYELYRESELNGNLFSTFTKDNEVVHVYYVPVLGELNIVSDKDGISALPPASPQVTEGGVKTSVTQLQSHEINGMGYVVQLSDGSFIVYDGGYAHRAQELWSTLTELNGGEEGIVIRMWVLTHSHNDHYPCFVEFGKQYGDRVTVEYAMISPINAKDTGDSSGSAYFNEQIAADFGTIYENTKICLAHTGMVLRFCDVTMEILLSAEEVYVDCNPGNFNNSSIVSRVYNDDGSIIFLADSAYTAGSRLIMLYGDYLKSDMCQIAHHGVEDFPLPAYQLIDAPILFYPCDTTLYNLRDRDAFVRRYLRESENTKELLLHDKQRYTRYFATE